MPEVRLSELKPDATMARATLSRIRLDYDWRSRWLAGTPGIGNSGFAAPAVDGANNLDKAASLFEAFTNQTDRDWETIAISSHNLI